ncbi:hypothetical protein CUR178_04725 [Leishmania enriettii]|uniref:Uncharacterized protein n=1 Tax=Leishmania enriettii TaxID=5663 RepID=A0A836GXK7_LEIEN|nr:hypothetical protein CUR178_04725 [Leishmania enriettii]
MHSSGNNCAAAEGSDHASPASPRLAISSFPFTPLPPPPTASSMPPTVLLHISTPSERCVAAAAEQEEQSLYSHHPSSPPLGHLTRVTYETDSSPSAYGASAAQWYLCTSPLNEEEQDKVTSRFFHALRTAPKSTSACDPTIRGAHNCAYPSDPPRRGDSGTVQPTTNSDRVVYNYRSNDLNDEDGNYSSGLARGDEDNTDNGLHCTAAVQLTAEEEQVARLHAYDQMIGGWSSGAEAEGADGTNAANRRNLASDTLDTILTTTITWWFSRSAETVAQTSSSAVPDSVKNAASTMASTIGVGRLVSNYQRSLRHYASHRLHRVFYVERDSAAWRHGQEGRWRTRAGPRCPLPHRSSARPHEERAQSAAAGHPVEHTCASRRGIHVFGLQL